MIVAQARTATIGPLSDLPHNETCTVQQSNSTYNFPQFFEGFEMERVLIVTEHNPFWETGQMNSVVRRRSFPFHSATATATLQSVLFKLRSRYNASREQIFLPE